MTSPIISSSRGNNPIRASVDVDSGSNPRPPAARPLRTLEKVLLCGLGALLLVGGATGTFLDKNAAGDVALIAAGSLFLLVALTGAVPASLKIGGNELSLERELLAEWAEGQRVVKDVERVRDAVAQGKPIEATRAIENLITLPGDVQNKVARRVESIAKEVEEDHSILRLVRTSLPQGDLNQPADSDYVSSSVYIGPNGERQIMIELVNTFPSPLVTESVVFDLLRWGANSERRDKTVTPLVGVLVVARQLSCSRDELLKWEESFDYPVRLVEFKQSHEDGFRRDVSNALQSIMDELSSAS